MIKPEYKDIPDTEFVPLVEHIRPELVGKYKINKKGETLSIQNNRINSKYNTSHRYPRRSFRTGNIKESYPIHILVAKTFLVPEEGKPEVDHVDRDPLNYELFNLRWVSRKENLQNRKLPKYSSNLRLQKIDNSGNVVEEFTYDSFTKTTRDNIIRLSMSNTKYKGYYWKRVDLELEEFFNKNNLSLEKLVFKSHPIYKDIMFCKEGLLKRGNIISLGWKDSDGRRKIEIGSKPLFIHRLVYETFSGDVLKPGEIIDHIDTDITNNNFNNLRVVTQKENMNNPATLKKLSKAVCKYSLDGKTLLKEFNSLLEANMSLGLGRDNNCIKLCCDGKISKSHGFIWKYKN